jgi:uncharacterized membrane protein (UPF0127 family)
MIFGVVCVLTPRLLPRSPMRSLYIGQQTYNLEVADTPAIQKKGLSERPSIPLDGGMLFLFASAQPRRCFLMQDMGFSLDVIWMGADKRVVHIERNVSPKSFPKQYCPDQPAQYVIELYAGQARKANIQVGEQLNF